MARIIGASRSLDLTDPTPCTCVKIQRRPLCVPACTTVPLKGCTSSTPANGSGGFRHYILAELSALIRRARHVPSNRWWQIPHHIPWVLKMLGCHGLLSQSVVLGTNKVDWLPSFFDTDADCMSALPQIWIGKSRNAFIARHAIHRFRLSRQHHRHSVTYLRRNHDVPSKMNSTGPPLYMC